MTIKVANAELPSADGTIVSNETRRSPKKDIEEGETERTETSDSTEEKVFQIDTTRRAAERHAVLQRKKALIDQAISIKIKAAQESKLGPKLGCFCAVVVIVVMISLVVTFSSADNCDGDLGTDRQLDRSENSSSSGGGFFASCFLAEELMALRDNNHTAPIASIVSGTQLYEGGQTLAVMKLLASEPMYCYNNAVTATGSHLV